MTTPSTEHKQHIGNDNSPVLYPTGFLALNEIPGTPAVKDDHGMIVKPEQAGKWGVTLYNNATASQPATSRRLQSIKEPADIPGMLEAYDASPEVENPPVCVSVIVRANSDGSERYQPIEVTHRPDLGAFVPEIEAGGLWTTPDKTATGKPYLKIDVVRDRKANPIGNVFDPVKIHEIENLNHMDEVCVWWVQQIGTPFRNIVDVHARPEIAVSQDETEAEANTETDEILVQEA